MGNTATFLISKDEGFSQFFLWYSRYVGLSTCHLTALQYSSDRLEVQKVDKKKVSQLFASLNSGFSPLSVSLWSETIWGHSATTCSFSHNALNQPQCSHGYPSIWWQCCAPQETCIRWAFDMNGIEDPLFQTFFGQGCCLEFYCIFSCLMLAWKCCLG